MNPVSVTYPASATGAQTPISIDWRIAPVNVGYAVIFNAGASGSVTVDHTYDNVNDPSVTPVWFSSSAITANTEGTITVPYQFVRITVGSLAGGTLTFKLNQATQIGTT
ncbi:hypothetical protein EOA79_02250 [Mesorhizobium sp. M1A.F.Ca.IN.020.03.2.1]|uniref:hypothetical protein n=1 Tax=Mesorhizobium sp. M1A.F.Ca.IN.020.03.2.1 TaxID=2496769 RepID=UPI000FD61BD0|nr:hypothetical protein [Mesorhizobium sp. M1A.F.Ca.IN.020.03.2.1]RUV07931.1 hypothetical protein EOA79_02250 [Mesorhizobium sp. M1A.F.Ca.IN.020.03.2.1]